MTYYNAEMKANVSVKPPDDISSLNCTGYMIKLDFPPWVKNLPNETISIYLPNYNNNGCSSVLVRAIFNL